MGQRFGSRPASQHFRSLLSHAVSGKGIIVQVITYQFALPAIANTPSPTVVLDPAPSESDTDLSEVLPIEPAADSVVIAEPVNFAPAQASAQTFKAQALEHQIDTLSVASQLDLDTQKPPATIVPIEALAEPPGSEQAIASIPFASSPNVDANIDLSKTRSPVNAILSTTQADENSADFYNAHRDYVYQIEQIEQIEHSASHTSEPEAPLEITKPEEIEFSWFSLDGPTEKEKPQKLAFVTQFEASPAPENNQLPVLIAGPQDLNPALSTPLEPNQDANSPTFNDPLFDNSPAEPPFSPDNQLPQTTEPIPVESSPADASNTEPAEEEQNAFIQWNDLEVGINSEFDNFGQSSWSVLPTLNGQLANGDRVSISSGFNQFEQDDFDSVGHIPLTFSWAGKASNVEFQVSGGVDFFNRLPTDTHASAIATIPLSEDASISVNVAQGPYLFNAQTLENEISRWQYGPEFYWQISPKVSLFSKLQIGNYSDGNWEQQSFSRLERKIGEEASAALNLTNQSFQQDVEDTSGYFSPRDFLVATAELSGQEKIASGLSCGLLGSVGQQRLAGEWALAYSGQAICTVDIASAIEIDLGYRFSNVSNDQSALADDSAYSSQQIIGGIRVRF